MDDEPDPRFSLANERTFLAWNRTALSLVVAGLGIVQLADVLGNLFARSVVGLPLVALGAVVALRSPDRLDRYQQALRSGAPLPRSPLPKVMAFVIGADAVLAGVLAVVVGGT